MQEKYNFDLVTTRNGDGGKSTDFNGHSYRKDDLLFSVLGDIDELNSQLGALKHALGQKAKLIRSREIERIQASLIRLSSLIASDPHSDLHRGLAPMDQADIDWLEGGQKAMLDAGLVIQPTFVLPGATPGSAQADLARAVCRRAERETVRFISERQRPDIVKGSIYLNRLSDFLFILARWMER